MALTKVQGIISWSPQLVAAGILFQTLFFKFSGAEESRYIFARLGMEPWGRVSCGVAELVAVALLLIPRTATIGAIVSLGLMTGAIAGHVIKLGVVVKNDGGLLFGLAVTVFVCSAAVLLIRRREIPVVGPSFMVRHAMTCGAGCCGDC